MSRDSRLIYDGYYEHLLNAIPRLNSYHKINGGEGVAYFLDDDFVVKEYLDTDNWKMFDIVFSNYCQEMQKFAEQGYNVPKIYAWLKMPNMKHYTDGQPNANRYYILEEKVKGRNLYYGFLEEFYPMCVEKFTKRQFLNIVHNPNENLIALDEIVKMYLKDYIQMNEFLESMSEDELAKLIVSAYELHMNGKHSEPDLYPCNVLVDGDNMKLIDTHIYVDGEDRRIPREILVDSFFVNLINLFIYNDNVEKLDSAVLYGLDKSNHKDYSYYKQKNAKVSKAAIERVLRILNKYCDNPRLTNPKAYMLAFNTLQSFLGKRKTEEVLENVNISFQP